MILRNLITPKNAEGNYLLLIVINNTNNLTISCLQLFKGAVFVAKVFKDNPKKIAIDHELLRTLLAVNLCTTRLCGRNVFEDVSLLRAFLSRELFAFNSKLITPPTLQVVRNKLMA